MWRIAAQELEAADYRFDGIEEKIYLACDAGATADQLSTQFAVDGDEELDAKEIEEFLDDLVQARLMYREGNCFLSLGDSGKNGSDNVRGHVGSGCRGGVLDG